MKSKNPFGVLTPLQMAVMEALAAEDGIRDFYLTGGTALAAFYLGHRLSEDLDFFTELPQAVGRIPPMVKRMASRLRATVSFGRRFQTLFECTIVFKAERVEMDFALDMPGRLKSVEYLEAWKLPIDNRLDIACNKLSALYERSEPKDFADIYCIHNSYLKLSELLLEAKRKYPELDDYGLAMAFLKVKGVSFWPRMLKPFSADAVRDFFIKQAKRLAKDF